MTFRCRRCEEKNLRCFVDTITGRCAGCISVKAECSLFVSEEEWEKVESEKRQKRLALLRAEAEVARLRLEVAEAEALERSYADRDHAILSLQDRAKEQAEGDTTPGTDLPIEPPLSEPSADLGWLQAELDLLDPSFDLSFLLGDPVPAASDAFGGTPVLNLFDLVLVVLEFNVRRQLGI
ncbi:hypothetical protein P3342_011841 [Pyrenophora teres f. teres]|nr:hypothetical protein P3342_011841 [Pyrenophora teres f. teres]